MTSDKFIKKYTLGLIVRENKILLGMKKRGFGQGRWNGFGGKVEAGESLQAAIKRELYEEAGLVASACRKFAEINFHFAGNPEVMECHLFDISDFSGEPAESEEMSPCWFELDQIPYGQMWPDDIIWLPLYLAGRQFVADFHFGPDQQISSHRLQIRSEADRFS